MQDIVKKTINSDLGEIQICPKQYWLRMSFSIILINFCFTVQIHVFLVKGDSNFTDILHRFLLLNKTLNISLKKRIFNKKLLRVFFVAIAFFLRSTESLSSFKNTKINLLISICLPQPKLFQISIFRMCKVCKEVLIRIHRGSRLQAFCKKVFVKVIFYSVID